MQNVVINKDYKEKYGFHVDSNYSHKSQKGLNEEIIKDISRNKNEPSWMLDFRLKSYEWESLCADQCKKWNQCDLMYDPPSRRDKRL